MADCPTAALPVVPAQDDHGAEVVLEARMPADPLASGAGAAARSVAMVVAATLVIGVYVGLPLVLVARDLLQALPNALLVGTGVLALASAGIYAVLARTTKTMSAAADVGPDVRGMGHGGAGRHRGRAAHAAVAIPQPRAATDRPGDRVRSAHRRHGAVLVTGNE